MTFRCNNQTACIVLVPLFVVVVLWINQHCLVPSGVVVSFRPISPGPGPCRLKRAQQQQQQQQPRQEEDVVTPLLQVRINNRSSRAIMLTNNNNDNTNAEKEEEEDEYGDVSFLDDFDVDAAIHAAAAAAAAPAAVTATSMVTATSTAITPAQNHNNSDNKVMNNPYTSRSASAASTSASISAGRQTKKLKLTTMETGHDEEYLENGSSRRSGMHTITPPASKQPPPPQSEIIITSAERGVLQDTLTRYFGFRQYREGQLAVIQTLLRGTRDVAVFWSTGSGKSLCYQIPSLVTQKITVIVSPLISLMEDQVSKLNNALPGTPAIFLGSGQRDGPAAERRALRGEYLFVYCTPEKLTGTRSSSSSSSSSPGSSSETTASSFLTQLAQLDLCLIAIDEAHCVSEWGHDFRPAYRRIGTVLRGGSSRNGLRPVVPIVALTATAVPRVQHDIVRNLHLRANPLIVQQSFDRSNLRISIKRKPQGGYSTAFQQYIQDWTSTAAGTSNNGSGSTIIYCPTQSMVMEVTQYLEQQLNRNNTNANATSGKSLMMKVQSYHGGQSMQHRSDAHINFLTGRTQIIVATLAFGMGIGALVLSMCIYIYIYIVFGCIFRCS